MTSRKNKAILVATIGTRDLAFKTLDDQWLSVGNDRKSDLDNQSQQVLVQVDLGQEKGDFRSLTEYLLKEWENYQERLKPIIIGQLIEDQHRNFKKIYLVATNQPSTTLEKFREKDTLFSAKIIQFWIIKKYKIETEIIEQCTQGENPSDFDKMFVWWKNIWRIIAKSLNPQTPVFLCLKGGVNQSSEAARITALTQFEDDSFFYDFHEDEIRNKKGTASKYTESKGTNYLWDRRQKEALALLDNWNYQAVRSILNPYWQSSEDTDLLKIKEYLEMAIKWNIADFQGFAQMRGEPAKTRSEKWWWTAYESAYLAVIRFEQGNTTEAMFHSFRAVEGLLSQWVIEKYKDHIKQRSNKSLILNLSNLSSLSNKFEEQSELYLSISNLEKIIKLDQPEIIHNSDWIVFFKKAKDSRNRLFHSLMKLEKKEVFEAWGSDSKKTWENRILRCLNYLTEENFMSLASASLMVSVHQSLTEKIKSYQP